MRKRFYFTVFLTGITFVSFAQNTCQKAQTAFANGEYDKAISYYNVCKRDFGNDVSKEIDNAKKCRD
ncbi:MAG: hypothetical protein LBS55_05285, partial [Prevotellaceae bacterium]|nr:hypothetical protein [Prevotellaceae bacterium]